MDTKSKTKAELELALKEAESQLIHRLYYGSKALDAFSVKKCLGSAVILELSCLGDRVPFDPIAIKDGLSIETIECLRQDIKRTFELGTEFRLPNTCREACSSTPKGTCRA